MTRNSTIRYVQDLLHSASDRWGTGEVAFRPLEHTIEDVVKLEVDVYEDPESDIPSEKYILEMKLTPRHETGGNQ